MTASELKLKIFRQIDSLEKNRLEELYGILVNFLNSDKEINDWKLLSSEQRQGILDAIDDVDSAKGIGHEDVMDKFRKKYLINFDIFCPFKLQT